MKIRLNDCKPILGYALLHVFDPKFIAADENDHDPAVPEIKSHGNNVTSQDWDIQPGESWMSIFQNQEKIGFSHRSLKKIEHGYRVVEKTEMKINTMGMVQKLSITSSSSTRHDFSLKDFDFRVTSGLFDFTVKGVIREKTLYVTTKNKGQKPARPFEIRLQNRPYLSTGIIPAINALNMNLSDEVIFFLFDPSTMEQAPVTIKALADKAIDFMGENVMTRKISFSFKGVTQFVWITPDGQVLKEEGFLGITLIKSDKQSAMHGIKASEDLTLAAGVKSNVTIESPDQLTRLKVKISGVDVTGLALDGGRQRLKNGILTITKETLVSEKNTIQEKPGIYKKSKERVCTSTPSQNIASDQESGIGKKFKEPVPFIQSDHPEIIRLAKKNCTLHRGENSSTRKAG